MNLAEKEELIDELLSWHFIRIGGKSSEQFKAMFFEGARQSEKEFKTHIKNVFYNRYKIERS